MDIEEKSREIAAGLQAGNSKVMAPITVGAVLGILVYITSVFHGLRAPGGPFHFQVLIKVFLCFIVLGLPNVALFELWVRKKLLIASRVLAWDGDPVTLSHSRVIESILALIDFPHQFVVRFIIHWIIGAPLIILLFQVFYSFPAMELVFLAVGAMSILCLMATLHYFVIKFTYARPLAQALRRYPSYYERAEFSARRIQYRSKVLIYIIVLTGSMTWLTTHLSLSGQARTLDMQRKDYLSERMRQEGGVLKAPLGREHTRAELTSALEVIIGGNVSKALLLGPEGNNLLGDQDSEGEADIAGAAMQTSGNVVSLFSGGFWRGVFKRMAEKNFWVNDFFRLKKPLPVRVGQGLMHLYYSGGQYTMVVSLINGKWRLVTVQPMVRRSSQMVLVIAMAGVAIILSLVIARFMHLEIMSPLSRLVGSSKQVAAGDLSDPPPVMADDEMGELSVFHLRMVRSIKAMVAQISEASGSIDRAAVQIVSRTGEMEKGSVDQSMAVESTTAAITQMNQAMGNIGESVDTLATSAEESSASILEMNANNEEVANSSEQLSTTVVETTSGVEQMSASIKEVARHVQSTSEKASEAAEGMREMREEVKRVDGMAEESASVSEQVTTDSESGAAAVQSTIQGIGKIWETSREAAEVIERLGGRAREIGRILTVIEDVTEETSLLALNAAIIAAQAGEHGRGFAVVADEIKDLAERTQASTTEIADLIGKVQADAGDAVSAVERGEESVSKGVLLSEEAGEALKKIQESAMRSMQLSQNISASMKEQSDKADRTLSFFENIASMIEQIGTATQEQTRGSDQIMTAAERMRDIAVQVRKATREQAQGGRQISQAIEHVAEIANYINTSQQEQKKAAQHVLSEMEKISSIAAENNKNVDKVKQALDNLQVLADDLKAMLDTFQVEQDRAADTGRPEESPESERG